MVFMRRVLIVEDDADMADYLSTQIKSELKGHVEVASDPYEAICRLCERLFDLVILDINLPDLDGYKTIEVLSRFLAQDPSSPFQVWRSKTPVILISGNHIPRRPIESDYFYVCDRIRKRGNWQEFWSKLSDAVAQRFPATYPDRDFRIAI